MVKVIHSHQSNDSLYINNNLVICTNDFRMKSETWSYLLSCISHYPTLHSEYDYCDRCNDSDYIETIDIPEQEVYRLISIHRRLDNVLANMYNIVNTVY